MTCRSLVGTMPEMLFGGVVGDGRLCCGVGSVADGNLARAVINQDPRLKQPGPPGRVGWDVFSGGETFTRLDFDPAGCDKFRFGRDL